MTGSGEIEQVVSTFWPLLADHVTARAEDDTLHAVERATTRRRDRRYKSVVIKVTRPERWRVACGARVSSVAAALTVNAEHEPTGSQVVLAWPPPATSDEGSRCRECWTVTGRKRPHEQWRNLLTPALSGRSEGAENGS